MKRSSPNTPCIGICSTTCGDTVCRGCKRFLHEVVEWNGYSHAEKGLVWQRLDQLLTLVVGNYIEVEDADRLEAALLAQNLRCQSQFSPAARVPELLRATGSRHPCYADFGLRPLPAALTHEHGRALYDTISQEFHALSLAHYERSFLQPMRIRALVQETARKFIEKSS